MEGYSALAEALFTTHIWKQRPHRSYQN
jgi:hypothetical protein